MAVVNSIQRRYRSCKRPRARLLALVGLLVISLSLALRHQSGHRHLQTELDTPDNMPPPETRDMHQTPSGEIEPTGGGKAVDDEDDEDDEDDWDDFYDLNATAIPFRGDYRELFSLTSRTRKFFPIHMDGIGVMNPSLIPHPVRHDMWVVTSTHLDQIRKVAELLYCDVGQLDDVLICAQSPQPLATAPSVWSDKCDDDHAYLNFYTGPRDARMFFGPDAPYFVYGSQSTWTCLALWLQDARPLLAPFRILNSIGSKLFKQATELHRPPPFGAVEKNFFLFWASDGKAYVHTDVHPRRVFAQLEMDGKVGKDLAPQAGSHDRFCMAKYMPVPLSDAEGIHQATNSLSVTLCKRSNPNCKPNDDNTFLMHIFQHKTYYDFHSIYDPYIMLFRQRAPFELYAIGQKPYWIHGRTNLTKETGAKAYEGHPEKIPAGHSEMFYVTSMAWKKHGYKYHGHIDDPLFLGFGIEDSRSATIDILAGDLMEDLAFC